jgi:UPF0716 family protein affecting phage T7 exclusion
MMFGIDNCDEDGFCSGFILISYVHIELVCIFKGGRVIGFRHMMFLVIVCPKRL